MSNRFIDYDNPSHHYIYKITDTETRRYYIGKRTCPDEPELDVYWGSGNEILEYQKQYGGDLGPASNGRFVKEIVEHCGSEGEAYYREEIIIGDRWQNDPLCMNLVPGGSVPPRMEGKDHPNYDPTKYHFYNHNTKTDFWATQWKMGRMGYPSANINLLVNGRVRSVKGIVLYENRDEPYGNDCNIGEGNPRYNPTKYHFYDHNTKTDFWATRLEMTKMGFSSSVVTLLIQGKIMSHGGVVLYENRDFRYGSEMNTGERNTWYDHTKYHFYDHNTNTDFHATQNDLHGMGYVRSSINGLIKGRLKSLKGIVLYENKDDPYGYNPHGNMGISFHKQTGKYQAVRNHGSKRVYLGLFETPEAANDAIQEYKAKLG